jgi:hypothetical protein
MEPTYFPFTTLSPSLMERLTPCLGPVVICRSSAMNLPAALARAETAGDLKIQRPAEGDEPELAAMRQAYQDWLQVHQGGATGWLKVHGADIPFFEDNATSQIRSQIRDSLTGPETPTGDGHLMDARLFLEVAQELDAQQLEIEADLIGLQRSEQNLFKALHADQEIAGPITPAVPPVPTGPHMLGQRMAAWARLVLACHRALTPLLVTDSRDAFEWALEQSGPAVPVPACQPLVFGPGGVSTEFRAERMAFFSALAAGDEPPGVLPDVSAGEGALTLTLYRLPGQSPVQVLRRWSRQETEGKAPAPVSTLVGWIQAP